MASTTLRAICASLAAVFIGIAAGAQSAVAAEPSAGAFESALETIPTAPGIGLFSLPATQSPAATVENDATGPVIRRRLSAVDPAYLRAMVAASDVAVGAGGAVSLNARAFILNLTSDTSVRIVKQRATTDELGNTVWNGVTVGSEGSVTLVINGNSITGQVRVGARSFSITPVDRSAHAIAELRSIGKPRTDDVVRPKRDTAPRRQAPKAASERPQAGTPSINIFIAYTPAALAVATPCSS